MGEKQKQVGENDERPIQYMKMKKNQKAPVQQYEPYMQSATTLMAVHGVEAKNTKSPYNSKPFANSKNLNMNNRRYNRQQI